MQVLSISDIKDLKIRNAVLMARDIWSKKQMSFNKAIIAAAKYCKVDIGKVTEHMLEITKEEYEKPLNKWKINEKIVKNGSHKKR